jgi:hypothetical protein
MFEPFEVKLKRVSEIIESCECPVASLIAYAAAIKYL